MLGMYGIQVEMFLYMWGADSDTVPRLQGYLSPGDNEAQGWRKAELEATVQLWTAREYARTDTVVGKLIGFPRIALFLNKPASVLVKLRFADNTSTEVYIESCEPCDDCPWRAALTQVWRV